MSDSAVFVDLPNFYTSLLKSGIEEARTLRDYFLEWFDFDRVADSLVGRPSDTWVFYSGRRFGPKENRVQDDYLDNFIDRANSLRGVTARDVNIPGQQREPISYICDKCGNKGTAQWESEKGIDASLTVQLFDTMDTWSKAYLLSGDADFVPAVASLRRKGKTIVGAGFADRSSALVRECYEYVDLCDSFLREDVAAYLAFKDSGIVKRWLTDDIETFQGFAGEVKLAFKWQAVMRGADFGEEQSKSGIEALATISHYKVLLWASNAVNIVTRHQMLQEFQKKFPHQVVEISPQKGICELLISAQAWRGVERRLNQLTSSIHGVNVHQDGPREYVSEVDYRFNPVSSEYEPII